MSNMGQDRTFADIVAEIAHGSVDEEATKELKDLVAEMMRLESTVGGKPKGKLTLTCTLHLDRGVLDVQFETRVTRPPKVRPRAILYPRNDGTLSENDTRQGSLDLAPKDVSTAGATNVRSITDRRAAAE